MASGIQNATDLIAVLDSIYNNVTHYDTYTGADGTTQGSLRVYYNNITKTATIFKRTTQPLDPLDPTSTYIVATFNPENIVTTSNTFLTKVMKNVVVSYNVAYANDVGLGAYVNVKTLIRNICSALGVNMAANFDELNPGYYEEMVNIVRKYYGNELENNAPYGMAKKVTTVEGQDVSTYHSYIPVMIIVEIAIYLNNLGIFGISGNKILCRPLAHYLPATSTSDYTKFIPLKLSDIISTTDLMSKSEIFNFLDTRLESIIAREYYTVSDYKTRLHDFAQLFINDIKQLINNYETEIDFNSYLNFNLSTSTTNTTISLRLFLSSLPLDLYVSVLNSNSSQTMYYYGDENFTYTTLSIITTYNIQDFSVATPSVFNKNVYERVAHSLYARNDTSNRMYFKNVKVNKYIKPYSTNSYYDQTTYWRSDYFDRFTALSNNTVYENLNLIPLKEFCLNFITDRGSGDARPCSAELMWIYYYIKSNNISVNDDDYLIYYTYTNNNKTVYALYIINAPSSIMYDNLLTRLSVSVLNYIPTNVVAMRNDSPNKEYIEPYENYYCGPSLPYANYYGSTYNNTTNFTFGNSTTITKLSFVYDNNNLPVYDAPDITTSNSLSITGKIQGSNIGELIEITSEGNIDGITLQEGATYPSSVIDYNSWLTTYPDWQRIEYSQPFFENDVIQNTYNAQWAAITVSKEPPTEQSDGQDGEIDTDNIDDVIDDIDNAEEDNDKPPTEPNEELLQNEGETPDDELERVKPNALEGGFINQYALDSTQIVDFVDAMKHPDVLQVLGMLVNNPIDAIISLQVGYIYNDYGSIQNADIDINGFKWDSLESPPKGTKLHNNIVENIDFGSVVIPRAYETYQDYTTTNISMYLPFVGFVSLDVNDFMGNRLDLEADIDTLTGAILYTICSYDIDNKRRELYQFQGNCQQQVPISQNDFTQLLTSIAHIGGLALTGATMGAAGTIPMIATKGGAIEQTVMGAGIGAGVGVQDSYAQLKPNVTHGGTVSGNVGLMGNMIPYIIISRKQIYDPKHEDLATLSGLPSNSAVSLGSISGYTVVKDVIVKINATDDECNEIERLLKGGVIL